MAGKAKIARRVLLSGGGVAVGSFAGALAWNWDRIPFGFLRQYWAEMERDIVSPNHFPDPSAWPDKGIHAAWLGHSTVLLKVDGFTVLTDPVFSARAGLGIGPITIGVKRLVEPALALDKLPDIDLVLVSHAHMDHLDQPSLRKLENKRTQVIMARDTSDLIRASRYAGVRESGWGQTLQAGAAQVTGLEVNHWGARMRTDTYRGYNGYLVQVGNRQILFAGDTAATEAFRKLPANGKPDIAIFPIGAYNPWVRAHCNPEEAWSMAKDARAEVILPIHHKTFVLSREPANEPIERLYEAAGRDAKRIGWKDVGETFHWS